MTESFSLRHSCLAGGGHPVALRPDVSFTADQLRDRALNLAAGLRLRHEERWALWLQRPSDFLTAFLALALAGKHIVLPGNMQTGTAKLLEPHFDGLLSDTLFPGIECFQTSLRACEAPTALDSPELGRDVSITLFTSGSTGTPKAVPKTLALLEAELRLQEQQWGGLVARLPVLATVSHQHIYGLLHAVLWPFLRQAPFVDEICQYPEELAARAEPHEAVVLVSSPTHLARLPQAPVLQSCAARFAAVFSSGGALAGDAAQALEVMLGQAPLEILGSTETGGVAWRQQSTGAADWIPLPQVEVGKDPVSGCLSVQAPHVGTTEPYVMGDQVELLEDGCFRLTGRADTIIKVEGKRLSLTEMERHLAAHPLVQTARVALVRTAKREEVGALVVPSTAGWQWLEGRGKLALNGELRRWLLDYFERPLLPRRWRYLAELPYNAQGKITVDALKRILQRGAE